MAVTFTQVLSNYIDLPDIKLAAFRRVRAINKQLTISLLTFLFTRALRFSKHLSLNSFFYQHHKYLFVKANKAQFLLARSL